MPAPLPPRRRLPPAMTVVLALAALLVTGCGDAGPTASPSAGATDGPDASVMPAVDLPLPLGDTDNSQVLLHDADGAFDVFGSIGQLQGTANTCTAVLLDTGASATAAAYAVTNGHCVGIAGADDVVTDRPETDMSVAFDWFVDVPEHRVVHVARTAWATMRGTDLAVLELAATPDELRTLGLRGWRPAPLPVDDGTGTPVAMVGIPVGAPDVDIPVAERFVRLGTCTLDGGLVVLIERQWLWTAALRNDCPEVLPGNSGSAVIDRSSGGLIGLINTTTFRGEQGAECWLDRPCEVNDDGEAALPDTSYAQPVTGLERCFRADGALALGGTCPLDPGTGVTALEGAPLAVNPASVDPVTGRRRPTWATTVTTDGAATYRYKIGPLGTTTCATPDGYSDAISTGAVIDDPLPATEQRLLLCVVAGDQDPAHAAMAVASVDTTPPADDIRFRVTGSRAAGWRIEPVFDAPELSTFMVKWGPTGSTRCTDPAGYVAYRRQPIGVKGSEAPARFCAIGYDDAGNASRPAARLLR